MYIADGVDWRSAPAVVPGDVSSWLAYGRWLARVGPEGASRAQHAWQGVLALEPDCVEAWSGLAMAFRHTDVTRAIECYGEAIRRGALGHDRAQRGELLALVGRDAEALADYDAALSADSGPIRELGRQRAALRALRGDTEGALQDLVESAAPVLSFMPVDWLRGDYGIAAERVFQARADRYQAHELAVWRASSLVRIGAPDAECLYPLRRAVVEAPITLQHERGPLWVHREIALLWLGQRRPGDIEAHAAALTAAAGAWTRPSRGDRLGVEALHPPQPLVDRDPLLFHMAQWWRAQGEPSAARRCLAVAAANDRTLIGAVAQVELRRLTSAFPDA